MVVPSASSSLSRRALLTIPAAAPACTRAGGREKHATAVASVACARLETHPRAPRPDQRPARCGDFSRRFLVKARVAASLVLAVGVAIGTAGCGFLAPQETTRINTPT